MTNPIYQLERPDPILKKYYIWSSFLWGPLFFIPLIMNLARYRTMRYHFDENGVSMQWGRLVHREISLRYARIQDIHLSSNIVERHLKLAKIELQTASAQSKAEMTIEGFLEFEAIRDFLYSKMHGAEGTVNKNNGQATATEESVTLTTADIQTLTTTLQEVSSALHDIRLSLAQNSAHPESPYSPESLESHEKIR